MAKESLGCVNFLLPTIAYCWWFRLDIYTHEVMSIYSTSNEKNSLIDVARMHHLSHQMIHKFGIKM